MAHSAHAVPDTLTERLPEGVGTVGSGGTDTADPEIAGLRDEVSRLRKQTRIYPVVSQVEGMLVERYRLTGTQAALGLLNSVAEKHGIELRALATAFIRAPRPAHGRTWFPARQFVPPPDITFDREIDPSAIVPADLLETLLAAALTHSGTELGNVQLTDPVTDALVLEAQHGFRREFTDFFAVIDDGSSACAAALRKGVRVSIPEVATDPLYDDDSRRVMLSAGARSVQSTPLVSPNGHCLGVYSTHDTLPGRSFSESESAVLDGFATQAAAWLDWHQRTVVLDALEDLHRRATVS